MRERGWFLVERILQLFQLIHYKTEVLVHSHVFMYLHLVAGQLHSTACTAERTLNHLQATLIDMCFELLSLQALNIAIIWTLYREFVAYWEMLFHNDIP